MLRDKTLTLAAVMVCLAIMPLYSTNVLAQGIPEVIQRLNNIQQTLNDQIIPKLDQCTQCPECPECTVGVPKTGQTIPYGPRDDGALQKGVPWPQPRFTDNDNGTVTDNLTGFAVPLHCEVASHLQQNRQRVHMPDSLRCYRHSKPRPTFVLQNN